MSWDLKALDLQSEFLLTNINKEVWLYGDEWGTEKIPLWEGIYKQLSDIPIVIGICKKFGYSIVDKKDLNLNACN